MDDGCGTIADASIPSEFLARHSSPCTLAPGLTSRLSTLDDDDDLNPSTCMTILKSILSESLELGSHLSALDADPHGIDLFDFDEDF